MYGIKQTAADEVGSVVIIVRPEYCTLVDDNTVYLEGMALEAELVRESLVAHFALEGLVPDVAVEVALDFVQVVGALVAQGADILGVLLDAARLNNARDTELGMIQDTVDSERDHLVAMDAIENGGARGGRRVAAFLEDDFEKI